MQTTELITENPPEEAAFSALGLTDKLAKD